jgi:drug/metabolite transporter (DMT)-like permease
MHRPLLFAFLAACGNAVFVYAQRGALPSSNPFLFMMYVVVAGAVLFSIAAGLWGMDGSLDYVAANARHILLGGAGFFTTYVGFYLLFSGYGAAQYALYATLSILTTSLGVGVLLYREPMNIWQVVAIGLAIASIALWTYGRSLGSG